MTSLQEQLQNALGSAYRIERELGVGGMATVFAGVETSLGRHVAIKVLQPELVAELSIDRFAREVRLAAQLQQANIVPLLSAGEAGGLSYYTMPLVDGSSLRARLASGVMIPLPEAISILKDVARALAYAHHAGVVHRDIKPDNILISGGTAVVSDFGIAKAMDIARTSHTPPGGTDITTPGSSLGTPGYMAPEQVAGDLIDHRADIYAWGVVAWELLATRHPFFARTTRQAMLAAHLTEDPPAIQEHARSVPPALAALVMACLNKDPGRRPQSAGEILAVLDGVATPMPGFAPVTRPWRPIAVAAAVVIAVIALAVWLPPRLRGSNGGTPADATPSVAVLPFENIGGDTAQEYFTDGITDELATALGRIPGLRVASRSAAYRLKGERNLDIRKVGADLGVRYLLLGSVRRSGPEIRIFAQLTEASNSVEIWSDRYSHQASDLIVIQDSLTAAITNALTQQLGPTIVRNTPSVPLARGTDSHVAYDLYLKGNHSLNRRRPGLEGAVRSFEGAIAEDPGFGRAHAGLANALALLSYFGATPLEQERVIDAANRALAIDSTLADAHVALGILHMAVGRYDDAQRALTRAIQIEPRNAAAHFQLGRVHTYAGRLANAVDAYEQAKLLEPFQATTATWLGYTLQHLGDPGRARTEETRAWELDSSSAVVQIFAAMTAHDAGRVNDALRYIRSSPIRSVMNVGSFAYILGRDFHRDSSLAAIREIEARRTNRWNDHLSIAFAALGARDTTRALDEMERAFARDEPVLAFWPLWSGVFDDVRGSPRFAELLRRAGIDPELSARR